MRSSIFVLSLTVLMACEGPQESSSDLNDLVRLNLNSNVRELTDSFFVTDLNGRLIPDSTSLQYISFLDGFIDNMYVIGPAGKKIETIFKTMPDGRWTSIYRRQDGQMLDSTSFQLSATGKYAKAVYYDSSGNVTEIHDKLKENSFFLITDAEIYDGEGVLTGYASTTYDGQNPTGYITKNAEGKIKMSQQITLNKHGDPEKEASEIMITDRQSLNTSATFHYDKIDASGNWLLKEERNETGKIIRVTKRSIVYVGGK